MYVSMNNSFMRDYSKEDSIKAATELGNRAAAPRRRQGYKP